MTCTSLGMALRMFGAISVSLDVSLCALLGV